MTYSGLAFSGAGFLVSAIFAVLSWTLHFDTAPLAMTRSATAVSSFMPDGGERTSLPSYNLLERPLFNSARRPFEEPKREAEPEPTVEQEMALESVTVEPAAQPTFRLLGVAKIDAGPIALVAEGDESQARWLRIGDAIGEWTMSRVDRSAIILSHPSREVEPITVRMLAGSPEEGGSGIE